MRKVIDILNEKEKQKLMNSCFKTSKMTILY